jgi:hypothetical protein
MYCKFLKLTSGENLIVSTEDECDKLDEKRYIEVSEPVVIHSMRMPYGGGFIESYIMQPWLKMSTKEVLRLPVRNIIIATNLMEKAESQYKQFIVEYENSEIATEEDIDEALSGDVDIDENEITEENDNDGWRRGSDRTYH